MKIPFEQFIVDIGIREKMNTCHSPNSGQFCSMGGGGISLAKTRVQERASVLGYSKISFRDTPKGLQVLAQGPKGKNPKALDLFINKEGNILNARGQNAPGW